MNTITTVEIFVGLLAAASVIAALTRRLSALPYSVALMLLGIALVALPFRVRIHIDSEVLLTVLLPALVFEGAYRTRISDLRPNLPAVLFLAIPGVLITAAAVAVALWWWTGLNLGPSIVAGTILAATDPAAILAVVSRLGVTSRLSNLVEGESLLNDGTGVAMFTLALGAIGTTVSPADIVWGLLWAVVGSAVIGALVGFVASRLLTLITDHRVELSVSVVAAYGSYLLAARLHESGLIATVVCGFILGTYGRRTAFSENAEQAIDIVWDFLGFLATSMVFLLIGFSMDVPQLLGAAAASAVALAALIVSRALIVYGLLGGTARLLHHLGWAQRMPRNWLHLIAWAGLRGAVAVALALSLPAEMPQRGFVQGAVLGCVFLTLMLQGTTAQLLVRGLRLGAHPQ